MSDRAIQDKIFLSTMTTADWDLLPALHALLEESSVSKAASRLGVTVPSMSRTLARLRVSFRDPLLVRAGRTLVPTAFAAALHPEVGAVVVAGLGLLEGASSAPLGAVTRALVIRANDGMVAPWLAPLVAAVRSRAPGVTLAFVAEGQEDPADLRDGRVDLDLGVLDDAAPELRTQTLLRDRFVAVVRRGHPLVTSRKQRGGGETSVTAAQLAKYEHIGISRKGRAEGPIDHALADRGLTRRVIATVHSASAALVAAAGSDLVTAVPSVAARALANVLPIVCFELPFTLPTVAIAQTWHPRFDADPAHKWLRECVLGVARDALPQRSRKKK